MSQSLAKSSNCLLCPTYSPKYYLINKEKQRNRQTEKLETYY